MKLNLNFDGFTKLRDWWKTVLSNFEIIQTECNKTRQIADNACTKEEAKAYINEFIGLSDEYMAAIEAFTDLYKENESAVAAMEEVFGERLKYYSKEELFDANEAIGEDAIFFCKAETENTPSNQTGILISKTDNKQMWIEENGEIYYRQLIDDAWSEWVSSLDGLKKEMKSFRDEIRQTISTQIITGSYTGNGAESRLINIGVTPKAVYVTDRYGRTTVEASGFFTYVGGLALKDVPSSTITVCNGGFNVMCSKPDNNHTYSNNTQGELYLYIAFI